MRDDRQEDALRRPAETNLAFWRLFVAAPLCPEARARVERVRARLASRCDRAGWRVSWVPANNLHVTLRFLGATRAERVEALRGALREAAAPAFPFDWSFRGLNTFGGPRGPRVLWLGIGVGVEPLHALAYRVRSVLRAAGIPPERRPFRAHLTLGRIRRTDGSAATKVLAPLRDQEVPAGRLDRIVLYRSHLLPTGPRYEPLVEAPLGGLESP